MVEKTTKRIFIAVPAVELQEGFAQTLKKLRINADQKEIDIKWSHFSNYHSTLVFLGERSDEQIAQIQSVMTVVAARHEPFKLKVQNIGAFADDLHARVLWLGLQNKNNLQALREDLYTELLATNLVQSKEEDFVPHITIARLRNPRNCKDLLSPFLRKSFGTVDVGGIILYESTVQSYFPVYKPIFTAPLASASQVPHMD